VFFIFKMRTGANWSRITMTVIGALVLVTSGISLILLAANTLPTPVHQPVIVPILSVIELLLIIAAAVFMYRPAANAWFKVIGR
jgi:hypothetical protein